VLAICIFLFQAVASAATVDRFGDGNASVVIGLEDPAFETAQNITLPAGCRVLSATMNVSSVGSSPARPEYPENVSVRIGDSSIWEFNSTGFGPLGRQDSFFGQMNVWDNAFGPVGGANTTSLRLPAGAEVRSATAGISGTGPRVPAERASMSGNMIYGGFGTSVSDAGDVNGDGYDDVIGGAPYAGMGPGNMETGYAGLFFGGPSMGSMDVYFKGPIEWDHMGVSVSGAGDVNGDGYDDVIVGADEYVTNSIGHAYIFFGGANMDNIADVTMKGEEKFDSFGISVSGAGDVNGDGYDDVIVGARLHTSAFGYYAGRAYIFFGGPKMDNVTDVVLDGNQNNDFFGISVSGAGDINGDGCDDVVVGANGAYGVSNEAGYAAVFLGGKNIDGAADLVIGGKAPGDSLGISVSGAGDLNGDGYDDLAVGASLSDAGGEDSGAVYLFFGAKTLDDQCDLVLLENAAYDQFGKTVSDAGDLNNDGYDDLLVGAPQNQSKGTATGSAYAYFGGPKMDARPDAVYVGPKSDESFAYTVSGAGDVDRDGFNETFIGMPRNSTIAQNIGAAAVFGWKTGLPRPAVRAGDGAVWAFDGYFNGTASSGDFSGALNSFLWTNPIKGNDAFGNSYIDVPVAASAAGEGALALRNLSITYDYTAGIADFSVELNDYLAAHRAEQDASGNLTIPVKVCSRTPGKVRLFGLRITTDAAPSLVKNPPNLRMDEDTAVSSLLCLLDYFYDDSTPAADMKFCLSVLSNSSIVKLALVNGTNLTADAASGPLNDNWTGTVELVVTASDGRGLTTVSDPFLLVVENVPDPPVITSVPPTAGLAGKPYSYRVTADDGDNDTLTFELLEKPNGMTGGADGLVLWTPSKMGRHSVSLAVSDGLFTVFQNYSIDVPNSPPRMANSTVPAARTDSPYKHVIEAVDDNGDALAFSLLAGPEGLRLDNSSGRIDWTPDRVGQYPVSIAVSDGIAAVAFDFSLQVLQGNRAPAFRSEPKTTAFSGVPYSYRPEAVDPDGDAVSFSAVEIPQGMVLNASTGALAWTPAVLGLFPVKLWASDGQGGSALQEFSLRVTERVGPSVEFLSPAGGQKLSGRFTVSGRCASGSLNITAVQVRFDNGPWKDAQGLESWQLAVDTTKLKDGHHTLQARAFDGMDYSEPVNRTVLVANGGGNAAAFNGVGPALVLAAVIAAAAAGTAVYLRRRKQT
jgi:hypothetical protein